MIKFLIRLVLAVLVANATWRVGSAYIVHYRFTDSVQETTQFRGAKSDEQVRQRIADLASQFDIPVGPDDVRLRTQSNHTIVDGAYKRVIEVVPGFRYPWPFTFHTDTLSFVGTAQ